MTPPELILFAGPTAYGVDRRLIFRMDVSVRPPVRRGDVEALVRDAGGVHTIAIVDGTFHSYPSVGHAEIREAVEAGWTVWGLSSMGALRAAEMRHLGVRGFGDVYARYAADPEFDDDEVAVLHASEAPYRPLSEPMIHIRGFLEDLAERGIISQEACRSVALDLKQRWYAERTLRTVHDSLKRVDVREWDVVRSGLADFGSFRSKTSDLVRFMTEQPWKTGSRCERN
ncbi:TfuA-like protein [Actinoallomurus purpureus]|uniref:TfuA-like protein n=1 Tax=Actinoallomurus purpureus TaxID=478114 RepID=UPI002093C1B9|nr:TfuA-like protein [Actinoallomurus purpureus]MCO6003536.1 TfuA-like protein [Actinoallomurus purpureus]